jgi:Cysteinyl-tRNA synthetase
MPDGKLVDQMQKLFAEMSSIIGVLEKDEVVETKTTSDDVQIENLIAKRQEARQNKNYAEADAFREQLLGMGIILEDTPQGVRWRRQ